MATPARHSSHCAISGSSERGSISNPSARPLIDLAEGPGSAPEPSTEHQTSVKEGTRGNIATGGDPRSCSDTPNRTVGSRSVRGNLAARYASGRADLSIGRGKLLAGFSTGNTRPELLQVFGEPLTLRSKELFGGLEVPVGRNRMSLIFDSLRFPASKRQSLLLSWRLPV